MNKVIVTLADNTSSTIEECVAVQWAQEGADELIRIAKQEGVSVARLSICGAPVSKDAVISWRYKDGVLQTEDCEI